MRHTLTSRNSMSNDNRNNKINVYYVNIKLIYYKKTHKRVGEKINSVSETGLNNS